MLAILIGLLTQNDVDANVVYSKVGDVELKMDIYQPTSSAEASPLGTKRGGSTPRKAIVMMHGGAWVSGSKEVMTAKAKYFAGAGFVVANISYRLGPKAKWPAMLDDAQTAVRYLRTNAKKLNIDPDRIGATGESAGGHLASFLGTRETRDPKPAEFSSVSSRVQAVLNFFGPCDMTGDFPPIMDGIYPMVLGKKKADAAEECKDASPLLFFTNKTAPMFIYQGLIDPLVNPEISRTAEAKLKELGIPVEARYLEGIGHEVKMSDASAALAVDDGITFLKKHLN
ncbi:MAG: alpha/beta hydrolase [Fimbriimonadaceae bacterium]